MSSVQVYYDHGAWRARAKLGSSAITGKQLRRQTSFPEARNAAEALRMANDWLASIEGESLDGLLYEYAQNVAKLGAPKARGAKKNTAHTYMTRARRWADELAGKTVNEVTQRDVLAAERRMGESGLADSSVNACHQFLSSFYGWACDLGLAQANPVKGVPHPKEPRTRIEGKVFSVEDAGRMDRWCAAKEMDGDAPDWQREGAFAIRLMLATGMRVGEALALRVRDCRLGIPDVCVCGTLTEHGGLRRQAGTKSGHDRQLSLAPAFTADLAAHIKGRAQGAPVCGADGYLRPSRVRDTLRLCCKELGIEYRPPHALRHTHATIALAGGASLGATSARLGHSKASTTIDYYEHVLPAEDAALAQRLEDALRGTS